jgi:threonine/homoserine/homoserine lactone efflux protein
VPAHPWLFFGLVLAVVVLPGMDMAFVLGSALAGGRRVGLAAVGGLVAGGACHVVIAATGIAAVLALLPAAFNALLLGGAAYVAWLGVGLLRSSGALDVDAPELVRTPLGAFGRAALTNLLNPKAYVFMFSVFPQFLRPARGPLAVQAAVLGLIIAITQAAVYGTVALLAAGVRGSLQRHPRANLWLARGVGLLLLAVALATALEGWRRA